MQISNFRNSAFTQAARAVSRVTGYCLLTLAVFLLLSLPFGSCYKDSDYRLGNREQAAGSTCPWNDEKRSAGFYWGNAEEYGYELFLDSPYLIITKTNGQKSGVTITPDNECILAYGPFFKRSELSWIGFSYIRYEPDGSDFWWGHEHHAEFRFFLPKSIPMMFIIGLSLAASSIFRIIRARAYDRRRGFTVLQRASR